MGAYSGTAILCQPLVGLWVDRAGRRPFVLAGGGLAVLAALGFAAAPTALGLFPLLRVVQGLAYSAYFVANFTLVVDLVPPGRRGQALGLFGISGLVSTAVGPALGELVARGFGFRVFFLAAAAVGAAALAVSAAVAEPPGRPAPGPEGIVALLRGARGAPRRAMAVGLVFGLGVGVVFTFVPTYATALGVERVGLFAAAYALAALAVRVLGGRLVDTAPRRTVIGGALALQAAGAGLLAALGPLGVRAGLPAAPLMVPAGLLTGSAHGFLYPVLIALVIDRTPEAGRARVVGVFSAVILAGQAAGAIGFGPVVHAVGYPPAFGILAVVLAGAVDVAFRLPR